MHLTRSAEDSDETLVLLAREGDAEARERLVRRHLGAAYAVALARLRHSADAQDAAHDALVTALRGLDGCREPRRFAAWLMEIVRNRAADLARRNTVRAAAPIDLVEPADPAARPDRDAERAELRDALVRALGSLPRLQREVVLLHDLEGLRHAEVGERIGVSEGAARVHLHHARRRLRAALAAHAPRPAAEAA